MSDRPRSFRPLLGLLLLAACSQSKKQEFRIETFTVGRRTITVDASASGAIEPINVVEVKSKASGQITKMTVETGSIVRPGDLLVQLDTRDVQNQYDQAAADVAAAEAKQRVSQAQKKRADTLFSARIITAQESETAQLDYANAQAALVRARTSLDLAKQRLEDATVTAPVAGTIIDKTVSLGQVITSATGVAGGGTTLLKMADLNKVRMRALFNETDIGSVQAGQQVRVTVDAYPDRPFLGAVEKIEPQAVINQSVTMFPVLVTLDNRDGFLKPGMNGEATVTVDRREGVLVVPNDAVRSIREARTAATLVGLNPDSVQSQVQAQLANGVSGGGGFGAGRAGQGNSNPAMQSKGEVALTPIPPDAQAQQAGQGGRGFGGQLPQVSDADCSNVRAALAKKPELAQQLQALRGRMQSGELDMQGMRSESERIYKGLGLDPMIARACQFRDRQAANGGAPTAGAAASGSNAAPGAIQGSRGAAQAQRGAASGNRAPVQAGEVPAIRTRARTSLVFVEENGVTSPKVVRLGVSDFDYTEVVSGLKEGDKVVLLAAAAAQASRDSMNARFRMMGGVPGMQKQTPGTAPPTPGAAGGGRRPQG